MPENKNTFTTGGQLTTSDIQNSANYSAKSVGATVGTSQAKDGTFKPAGNSAGIGSDKGSASSTTQAAISGIAGNAAARTGDPETGIQKIFDADKVQNEIDAQVLITRTFGAQASEAWGKFANNKFAEALKSGDEEGMRCWGPDGACRAGGHAVVGGLSGGIAGAAGAGVSSMTSPYVQAFLMEQGLSPNAAQAMTQLVAIGSGAAVGGTAGATTSFNEASNNAVMAIPLIVEGIIEGGALAARACLSSPACVNALRLGGTAVLAKVASMLPPEDLAKIPGFEAIQQQIGALIRPIPNPAEMQKLYGTPPLQNPEALKSWLANALDGYPADEAEKWAKGFITTLPAAQQSNWQDFILLAVQDNAAAGSRREREVTVDLQAQYPNGSVQNQQYLRDKDGNIVIDPLTNTARRLDHVVIVGGKVVDVVETTSLTARKNEQIAHENEVRANGGVFIRDRNNGQIIEVPSVSRIERRP